MDRPVHSQKRTGGTRRMVTLWLFLIFSGGVQSESNPASPRTPLTESFQADASAMVISSVNSSSYRGDTSSILNKELQNADEGSSTFPTCHTNDDGLSHLKKNESVSSTTSTTPKWQELSRTIQWYTIVVCNPVIGAGGLIGNLLSAVVIARSGLSKPSNIFLLGLAVGDSCCLLGAVNVPNIMRSVNNVVPIGYQVWELPEQPSYICFVFAAMFSVIDLCGAKISSSICSIIAIERFIAVYFPLHFTSFVTTRRAWMLTAFAFFLWVCYFAYFATYIRFLYVYLAPWDIWVGFFAFLQDNLGYNMNYYFLTPLGNYVPLATVTTGSVLIAIRISITSRSRQQMTGRKVKASSSRTTVTLLMVCIVFCTLKMLTFIKYAFHDVEHNPEERNLYLIYVALITTVNYINSSCNFIIYVAFNPKFRTLLKARLMPQRWREEKTQENSNKISHSHR